MMFLIIKTISEGSEGKSTFKLFDIALDGEYFCSLRYSQLHSFSEEVKKTFPLVELPPFPPKKLLPLDDVQMEERRFTIEKFIQALTLNALISTSNLFKNYLLAAQFASWDGKDDPVSLSVYLLNGKTVEQKVSALDRADVVQERVSKEMGLPDHLVYYFALHLVQVESDDSVTVLRRLYDFESPYVTLNMAGPKKKIVLMRRFWHNNVHAEVVTDKIGRNLLFLDAAHGYERGWWKCRDEDKKTLDKTHQKNQKKEFLELISKQTDYLTSQVSDLHIEVQGEAHIGYSIIGSHELRLYYAKEGEASGEYKQYVMALSRIRCWKMAFLRDKERLMLALHYLVAKDTMDWVYVWGNQVTYLAQCIQAVVQDLIRIAQKKKIRKPNPDCGDVPRLPKFNRREIPQVVIPRRPPPPKATPTAAQEPRKLSSLQPSSTSSSVPSTPTKQPGTPATLESAGDKREGGDDHIKTDQTDGPASSSQKPVSTRVSTSSLDTSSSKTSSVIPKDKLVSFTSVEEDTESSKSIAHVFKKLTSFKSSEVPNDLFEQGIGDDDL